MPKVAFITRMRSGSCPEGEIISVEYKNVRKAPNRKWCLLRGYEQDDSLIKLSLAPSVGEAIESYQHHLSTSSRRNTKKYSRSGSYQQDDNLIKLSLPTSVGEAIESYQQPLSTGVKREGSIRNERK